MGTNAPGTAAVISIEPRNARQNKWAQARWIRIGFDDEFVPAVMIENNQGQAFNNRSREYFDEAEKLGPGSSAHHALFNDHCIRTTKWKNSQVVPTAEYGWAGGFSIIEHSKACWPDHSTHNLDAINLGIKFSGLPDRKLGGSNNATDSIWTIEVSTLGDSSSEWARPKEQPPGGRGGAGVDDALWFVNLSGWRCVLLCTGLQSL
jgi:hypothetical protein